MDATLARVKASRWEILGAWLRIWTPPKDVEIPPVPRRAAAVVALLFARTGRVARLYASGRAAQARAVLLADVRARILRDARARVAAGTLEARQIRSVRCRYRPGDTGARVRLACLAITSQTAGATVGQPFTVAGSLRDGRYAWCHENPRPAEGASRRAIYVPLSAACRS